MGREWLHQSVRGGVGALHRDPIGILLPAAGALLVQVAWALSVRFAWTLWALPETVVFGAAAYVSASAFSSLFRAPLIAAGARALDVPASGWRRFPALFVVQMVVAAVALAFAAVIAVPAVLAALLLASRQLFLFAAVLLGLGAVGAAFAGLAVRAMFAFAPIEAVLGGQGPLRALALGVQKSRSDRVQLLILILLGDILVGFGGLFCGAGALPGYPFSDLALTHRWLRIVPEST